MNNIPAYETKLLRSTNRKIQYLFESRGHKSIIKAIEYSPITKRKGRIIYNLGFGDYDENTGGIIDNINSNNGDMRRVFSTVLNTVPKFFKENENAGIWVAGSDSSISFKNQCKYNCKKNCKDICKNIDRRIKIYRYYVDKNFKALNKEYKFYGLANKEFVQYLPGNDYPKILVYKKKIDLRI